MKGIQVLMGMVIGGSLMLAAEAGTWQYRLGPLDPKDRLQASAVVATVTEGGAVFSLQQAEAMTVQLQIRDGQGRVVYDSGPQLGPEVVWDWTGLDWGTNEGGVWRYQLQAWNTWSEPLGTQLGEIRLLDAATGEPTVVALAFDDPDNFTIGGYLGVGTDAPQRAVHLKGSNAVFRMDRDQNSAAFMLVRTDGAGNPLKTYVVGVNASGANEGEFIINDLGAAVAGGGSRRLTIDNTGNATFTGSVTAGQFIPSSSLRLKTNVQTLEDAVGTVQQLRGVRFDWKATGKPALGLIAEEVAQVLPEVVSTDAAGQAQGVNYDSLVALLVEASKAQQQELDQLSTEIDQLQAEVRAELDKARSTP